MTLPRMDFLSTEELAQINADVVDLLGDTQLSVAITFRDYQSRVFTPSTGVTVATYADYSIRAIRNAVPAREVQASLGLYQAGDLRFIISRALLPITPNKEDLIVDGASTYNLISWDSDPISQLWRIVARLVA